MKEIRIARTVLKKTILKRGSLDGNKISPEKGKFNKT